MDNVSHNARENSRRFSFSVKISQSLISPDIIELCVPNPINYNQNGKALEVPYIPACFGCWRKKWQFRNRHEIIGNPHHFTHDCLLDKKWKYF
jgi:hypothetical protein